MSKEKAIEDIKKAISIIDVLELSLAGYDKRNRKAVEILNQALKELED